MTPRYGKDDGKENGEAGSADASIRIDVDGGGTTSVGDSHVHEQQRRRQQQQQQHVIESTPLLLERNRSDETSVSAMSAISSAGGSVQTIRALPGMTIRSHGINADGTLRDCTSREALSGARAGSKQQQKQPTFAVGNKRKQSQHFWIDIDADERDADELRSWLDQLRLPKFFLSVLAEPSGTWASQVIAMRSKSLTVVRFLPERETSDEMAHLAALSVPNLLLTFTSCPKSETGDLYNAVHRYMHDRERLPDASSSGALLAWLRFHVERTSRSTRDLRRSVLAMDEAMDRNVTNVGLEEIIDTKDQLLRLLSVAEEQNEVLEALAGAEADTDGLDFTNLRGALSVLLATAGATERMALRLEKQISDLRQRYEGHQQERINRRLAVLTVLSAVFLPLTLVTGIWGMNFEYMPELKNREAYPLALLAMFAVAVTMLCYFWRTGWFD